MADIRTERLLLRQWRDKDLAEYAAMNADRDVRRFFPGLLTRAESDRQATEFREAIATRGYGFWAVEAPGEAPFIGFVGLQPVGPQFAFAPAVEAGWRLARRFWGRGYATEAACAALAYGLGPLGLPEIVAMVASGNFASRRVMEHASMRHSPADDFDHPAFASGHPGARHTLYRIAA